MNSRLIAAAVVSGSLLASSSAFAQESAAEEKPPCTLGHSPCTYPHFALALEGGVSSFNEGGPFGFSAGVGAATAPGPSWGLRVGYEIKSWLAIDAHYIGMNDHVESALAPNGAVSLFTNAALAEVRLTIPLRYVQPYFFTGFGVYSTSITGTSGARAGAQFSGSTEPGVPIGLGLGIPITGGLSVGAELAYHRFFGESFAKDEEIGGGDLTTMNAVVRVRL